MEDSNHNDKKFCLKEKKGFLNTILFCNKMNKIFCTELTCGRKKEEFAFLPLAGNEEFDLSRTFLLKLSRIMLGIINTYLRQE